MARMPEWGNMDKFIKFNLIAIGIVASGCSSNFLSSDKGASNGVALEDEESLDAGITNQAPKISCFLSNWTNLHKLESLTL